MILNLLFDLKNLYQSFAEFSGTIKEYLAKLYPQFSFEIQKIFDRLKKSIDNIISLLEGTLTPQRSEDFYKEFPFVNYRWGVKISDKMPIQQYWRYVLNVVRADQKELNETQVGKIFLYSDINFFYFPNLDIAVPVSIYVYLDDYPEFTTQI